MNLDDIINSMTPEVYQRLSTAVELGKWPDGVTLTEEQKENCLQLVMLWQARHNTEAQHMTIDTNGQMVMKSKQQLKEDFGISAKPIAMFKYVVYPLFAAVIKGIANNDPTTHLNYLAPTWLSPSPISCSRVHT